MTDTAKLFRELNADEVAALPVPPHADVETPTTSLTSLRAQSTAEAHLPGIAVSAKYAGEHDTLPDPAPHKEN